MDIDIRVRPFHPHDYPRLVKIKCEAEGECESVAAVRRWDEHWDHSRFEKVRVVAEDEEHVAIGYGEIHHEPSDFHPRRYFLHLAVDPAYRRRGVATALVEQLQAELDERDATLVRLRAREGSPGADFAQRHGFVRISPDATRPGMAYFELSLGES